ncbi:MAG: ACT domain-containing protein [Clostridia bacterium]|nr:ACT domain-containing protein [Clostridia bacterium]MBQ8430282.1 ACT domain-containing protein [Clostridia bacterium]
MVAKQITVFIENRTGRLGDILDVLKENGVNIISMSLSDTSDYGLLRVISDKPQEGKAALSAAGFSCMLSDVFIVKVPHEPGALQNILRVISDEALGVEYMYGLSVGGDEASIVVKTSDLEKANEVFEKHKIETLSDTDLH